MFTAHLARQAIAKSLSKLTQNSENHILQILNTPKASLQNQFTVPLPKLINSSINQNDINCCQELISKFEQNNFIEKVTAQGPFLHFDVKRAPYIQSTLSDVYQLNSQYGHHKQHTPSTVIIDYSSPNIAKPFHAGHLRSTILGNFLKRIHEANGYKTIGINYLGDWGKQYGLLAIGFDYFGDPQALKQDPIHHLYQVYVKINELAKTDPRIDVRANDYFKKMESGDLEALKRWKEFRDYSIESYKNIYKRLNIGFDYYSGESETEPYIMKVYQILKDSRLVKEEKEGWVIDLERFGLGRPFVRRGMGTSLYLTRDLASILLRYDKLGGFDKSIYVVGIEQELYLKQLFKISELIYEQNPERWPKVEFAHANFGRVMGMSTRKGTVVFLEDILDTAKEKMLENMQEGKQNKLEGIVNEEAVADQLGVSAVIVQDMVAKRIKNYQFSWDRMTASKGYTGVYLQYTHARLCSIERNMNIPVNINADTSLLKEKEAFELTLTISQFPDIVQSSCKAMDPCILVQYLFRLSHIASQANSQLRVKGAESREIAEARLLLFWAAKTTLANGLRLLGVNPLNRI
ncbi:arginyl-tRNA synthetase [Cokeromyces recurvatus]|uniref:arginyl-tRNA synthetase n=1 Tax=Cokeromyces recurvatus TaxID=90255 RepID=UPI002220C2A9|nr:arginyl-tRNA synthetase [Cokeromyces recurvatus]KAI7898395.1 arginyl-tRNA synthetase [Cokeromyces recurvatus]